MRRSPIVARGTGPSGRVIYGAEPQVPEHGDVWIRPWSGKAVVWDEINQSWVETDMEGS